MLGPPFAGAVVDGVTTLNPGENATVATTFDGSNVLFTFAIPHGVNGTDGANGTNGTNGADGAPGEVTAAALATAIAGTAANSNAVATLDSVFSDPPSFAECEAMRAKLNKVILGMRR